MTDAADRFESSKARLVEAVDAIAPTVTKLAENFEAARLALARFEAEPFPVTHKQVRQVRAGRPRVRLIGIPRGPWFHAPRSERRAGIDAFYAWALRKFVATLDSSTAAV